jgi:hypothetical protein
MHAHFPERFERGKEKLKLFHFGRPKMKKRGEGVHPPTPKHLKRKNKKVRDVFVIFFFKGRFTNGSSCK